MDKIGGMWDMFKYDVRGEEMRQPKKAGMRSFMKGMNIESEELY